MTYMAIFGDLSDMSTPEVLTILGQRTGKLLFDLPGESHYELHLCEATLRSLQVNGTTLQSELPVVFYHLAVLNRAREGRFEFVQTSLGALEYQLNLPRQELLARDDGGDEALERTSIPDKQTRFRLQPNPNQSVPENLQLFLQQSRELLVRGSSAEEVAQALGMSAMRAQIYFQRLRVLGLLAPVRAYLEAHAGYAPDDLVTDKSEARRLEANGLEASRVEVSVRPGQTLSATPLPRPASYRRVITRDSYTNTTPDKPQRSFVRRLLSALTLGAIR